MFRTPDLRLAPNRPARTRASVQERLPVFLWDAVFVLAMMGLYFLARGQAPSRIDAAVALSLHLVRVEQALGIFQEPAIQDASLRFYWMKELANFTYAYLHFPVMAVVAVWLWWRGRERFLFLRNVMFISMGIGVAFYYLMPAAPPRLLAASGYDFGFSDTVFGGATAVRYAQPSLILNEYAAIPSYHFGWILMSAAAVWANTHNRVLRGLSAALVVLMTWAIVASANHFFIDMALGGLVIGISWSLARRWRGGERASELVLAPVSIPTEHRDNRYVA
jgi:hypothetical protein